MSELEKYIVVAPAAIGFTQLMEGMPAKQVAAEFVVQEGFVAIPAVCVIQGVRGVLNRVKEDMVLERVGTNPVRG